MDGLGTHRQKLKREITCEQSILTSATALTAIGNMARINRMALKMAITVNAYS